MNIYFLHDPWILENHNLKALNILFQKVVLSGREKCGGTEEEIVEGHGCQKRKKTNMWHGRGNSGGAWPPASPAPWTRAWKWAGTFTWILINELPEQELVHELPEQELVHELPDKNLFMNSLNKNLFMNSCMKKNLCVQCKLYTLQCTLHNEYYSIYSVQITWNDAQGKWIKSLTRSEEPFKFLDSTLTTWYNLTWSK